MRLIDHALEYLERGWSIIPIANGAGAKKPAVKWKPYQTQRPSQALLRSWLCKEGVTGIAVIFGAVSGGLASRDFDTQQAYSVWAQDHPELAMMLPTAKSARGYHVYFRAAVERFQKFPDGEYRGTCRQYLILPPSLHPRGTPYEWVHKLPKGELPLIDPVKEGLIGEDDGCNRENGETEVITSVPSVSSVGSVDSVHSVPSVAWDDDWNRTLPPGEGQRHRCIFDFARLLKGRPEYADASADQMESVFREWHRRALPFITTKFFDESRIEFIRAWNDVKYPLGKSPTEVLMQKVKKTNPPAGLDRYDNPGILQVATLCAILQANAGSAEFYLSARTAARVLGVADHTSCNRWLNLLKHDGLLVEVKKGVMPKATRWRWKGALISLPGPSKKSAPNCEP